MKQKLRGCSVFAILIGLSLCLVACASAKANEFDLRVAGARDVLPLIQAVQDLLEQETGLTVEAIPSSSGIQDLKDGKVEVVLMGREPEPGEMDGLQATQVAYDAVVILVNTRTYAGGEQWQQGAINLKLYKFDGLKNLSLSELKEFYENLLHINPAADLWFPSTPYYRFQTSKDLGQDVVDPKHPDQYLGVWKQIPPPVYGWMVEPGRYDTQTFLLDQLGLPEPVPQENQRLDIISSFYESEEELVSANYQIDPDMAEPISWRAFDLMMMAFSRQVAIRAGEHNFAIQALMINGIDPLGDPQAIYSGAYPLSRKVYLVTRQPESPETAALVQFLLTPTAQKAISQARFLPLSPEP